MTENTRPDVSIIIVNYNTYRLTTNCIRSVYDKTSGLKFEVILVDNASSECDPQSFKNDFPDIDLICSSKNLGFAGGNNLGIAKASGKYILLLNSDTELVNNAVEIALRIMQQDKSIGVLSGRLIYPDGTPQSVAGRFPSISSLLRELSRINSFTEKSKISSLYHGDLWDYTKATETDWVWGAFFMFPANILESFPDNKLHEDFFMYYEDVLWCHHVKRNLGLKIFYSPEPVVIHYLGGSNDIKDASENFRKKILPNESSFLIETKGKMYAAAYYLIKGVHHLSLRTRINTSEAGFYFRYSSNILRRRTNA